MSTAGGDQSTATGAATYNSAQAAELLGCSTWALYQSVRRGDCPLAYVRVGRLIRFPRGPANALLGLDAGAVT